jgi:hypothetical protein
MIKIESVENGWILTDERDPQYPVKFVYKEALGANFYHSKETMKSFCELLWKVNEVIGPNTSRYDPHRVHISLKKGDKYESPREKEEMESIDEIFTVSVTPGNNFTSDNENKTKQDK